MCVDVGLIDAGGGMLQCWSPRDVMPTPRDDGGETAGGCCSGGMAMAYSLWVLCCTLWCWMLYGYGVMQQGVLQCSAANGAVVLYGMRGPTCRLVGCMAYGEKKERRGWSGE